MILGPIRGYIVMAAAILTLAAAPRAAAQTAVPSATRATAGTEKRAPTPTRITATPSALPEAQSESNSHRRRTWWIVGAVVAAVAIAAAVILTRLYHPPPQEPFVCAAEAEGPCPPPIVLPVVPIGGG